MRRVIVESPFAAPKSIRDALAVARADAWLAGELREAERAVADAEAKHRRYLRALALFCLMRGDSPYASHAYLPQWLDDNDPDQRQLGIDAGLAWAPAAELVVFGVDLGISSGMRYAHANHAKHKRAIEYVKLGAQWDAWQASYTKHTCSIEPVVTKWFEGLDGI